MAQAPPSRSASTLGDSIRSGLPQEVGHTRMATSRCPRHPGSHLQLTGWRGKPVPWGLPPSNSGTRLRELGRLSAGGVRGLEATRPAAVRGLQVTVHVGPSCTCPRAPRRRLENVLHKRLW